MGRARFPDGEGREALAVNGAPVEFAVVSMGNPHAVTEHDDPAAVVRRLGPQIETAPRFPERTNVEFIRPEGPRELTMRVWERGVGETLACGTGACAAAVAAVRLAGMPEPHHRAPGRRRPAGRRRRRPRGDDDRTGRAPIYEGELSPELVARLEAL